LHGVTLHVLRHSFAAVAAEMGFSELTIAGLLGHSVPGVTARYAHVPDSALVAAADRVAARIASALEGEAEAEVVSLQIGSSTQ
jgi:site-specific recombinase XerD